MRILFIRGGGLGDFIVTLPTLRLAREKWPEAHIEVLGHPHIAELGVDRFYLNGVRSVNHGPLSAFFTPRAVLDPAWMDYIADFDLVASYFYDPDQLFLTNLQRCQPGRILTHPPRVPEGFAQPAAHYFAGILQPLGLTLGDNGASDFFSSAGDDDAAASFLTGLKPGTKLVAIHPGSGGQAKNWAVEKWAELGPRLIASHPNLTLLLVEGEADAPQAEALLEAWKDLPLLRARWLPLPILGALFKRAALFVGHDSGVTHLAGASNRELPVVALFGATDPAVWSPPRSDVTVLQGKKGLGTLSVEEVLAAAQRALGAKER
jgi:heptosyltransferase-3